jgi:formylglycine-generating enzyme required for sulfatase activity/AmiR/NasT family two-component response regulator
METIILVIDDNPELVDGVKLTLEMEGYQVLAATNGQEALELLERITPNLILADIMMPEMDGYELYERVHQDERWVHVPFIFVTAKTEKADIQRGKEMGVDDYITKPFDPDDLVAAIRGRLKRMVELTSYSPEMNQKGFWARRLVSVPVPLLVLAAVAVIIVLIGLPTLILRQPTVQQVVLAQSPLQSGIDEATVTPIPTRVKPVLLDHQPRADIGEMITIPAGEFIMGGDDPNVLSERQVNLSAFEIDKYEVTNAQYHQFVEETDHSAPWGSYPAEQADYAVTGISWEDAKAYCEWAGKRLPTEAEWEKAARGTDGQIYPWGNEWANDLANTKEGGFGGVMPVGSYPDGASPYGVEDMAGNVWEWVEDWSNSAQDAKVMRGGAWNALRQWTQTYTRNWNRPGNTLDNLGFRCVR